MLLRQSYKTCVTVYMRNRKDDKSLNKFRVLVFANKAKVCGKTLMRKSDA